MSLAYFWQYGMQMSVITWKSGAIRVGLRPHKHPGASRLKSPVAVECDHMH